MNNLTMYYLRKKYLYPRSLIAQKKSNQLFYPEYSELALECREKVKSKNCFAQVSNLTTKFISVYLHKKETIFENFEYISRRIVHYDIIAYGIGTCVKIVPRRKEPIIQTKWTFKYLLSHITLAFIYKGQFKFTSNFQENISVAP